MASMRFTIRVKLQLILGGAVALVLGILIVFVSSRVSSTVRTEVRNGALESASRYAASIQAQVGDILATARTLGQIVEDTMGQKADTRRPTVSRFLRSILERNAEYMSVWSTWQPGALDGLDDRFRDTSLGNSTGRFDQTWYRAADDTLALQVETEENIVASDYFNQPIKDNQETVIGPYVYEYGDGRQILETSMIVPVRDARQRPVGVVAVDTLQSMYQRVVVGIKPYGDGFAALYGKDGVIGGHGRTELLGKSIKDEASDFAAGDFAAYEAAVSGGKETTLTVHRSGEEWLVVVKPFRLGASYSTWSLALFTPAEEAYAVSVSLLKVLLVAVAACLVLILALIAIVSRSISSPVLRVAEAIREISEGEGDLSLRLPVGTRDETADLASHFNDFMSGLEGMVVQLKEVGRDGSALGAELAANSEESSATAEELAATVRSLSSKVSTLDGSIRSVSESVGAISSRIDEVGGLVGRQSEAVDGTSASARAILDSLAAMSRMAGERGELADGLARQASEGEAVVGKVLSSVQEIGGYAARIAEMAAVINDVAERTNLLAMNAAIEAAHAGERGKGFAVVADEIRKLAEMTGRNAATIGEQIRTVTRKIGETVSGAQSASSSIKAMTKGMGDAARSFREVLAGLEGLSEEGESVAGSLGVLVASAEELRKASEDIDARSDEIRGVVTTIERLSSENTAGFTEMAQGIQEMSRAAEALSALGVANSRNGAVMEEALGKFKVATGARTKDA